jgi:cytochrome c-type biogenesis protein CcmH
MMTIVEARGSTIARTGTILLGVATLGLVAAVGVRGARDGHRGAAPVPRATAAATPLAALEQRVAARPGDAEGWRLLGTAQFEAERYTEAAATLALAARLQPRNAAIWSALGEARVLAANTVGTDAHAAFTRALAIDPKDPRARYFLAVEKDIAGDHRGAVADWIALLGDAPADAAWTESIRALVQQVAAREKLDVAGTLPPPARDIASAAIPGPTPEQIAAAGKLTPTAQDQMARAMVATLAARLAQNPRDAAGWIRLMRADMVLGETQAARAALAEARRAFTGDAATVARFAEAAQTLGIGTTAHTR